MSSQATTWAWSQQMKSHSAKLVLLCLADSHDAYSGRCDSTVEYIARMTGLSHKTIKKALGDMEKAGLLSPTQLTVSATGFALGLDGGGG